MMTSGQNPQKMLQKMMQGSGGGGSESPDTLWKTKFHETLAKKSVEEKPVYESSDDGSGKWVGTCSIQGGSYSSPQPAKSKKEAEQLAAKAAFKELYPAE